MNRLQLTTWGNILLLLLPLYSGCLQAADTLVVGSKDTADGGTQFQNAGPAGDGYSTTIYTTGSSQVVIGRATALQYSNVKIKLNLDTAATPNTGVIYCSPDGTGGPISLENHFLKSPYIYDGHQLFKTNIQGLYFTARMYGLESYGVDSLDNFYIGDTNPQPLNLHTSTCPDASGWYLTLGGLVSKIDIDLYNDATFDPDASGSIALLSDAPYHYSLKNQSPGGNLNSRTIFQTFNMGNVTLTSPTCLSAVLTGSSVSQGDTVGLGEYSPKEVIDGVNGVPFSITLKGCYRVTNIEVKLTTGAPALSASLLGNSLTANAASGVGVEIKGKPNSHYPEVTLMPNDASSIYKAYGDNPDNSNGIIGSNSSGSPADQTLNFTATLKQDDNQQIRAGDFKATGIFSITYP
ncbi:TPA: fimbrial protein [Escherichia coli]|nr:fimbrial protein [Escherichia coli]HDB9913072.1 fimbrial protein [Escherichia coli]